MAELLSFHLSICIGSTSFINFSIMLSALRSVRQISIHTSSLRFTSVSAVRPRRSVLYVPGSNERAMMKAATTAADCIILDLEDAVAPDMKETARENIRKVLTQNPYGKKEVIIRVNAFDTEWAEKDVDLVSEMHPHGVLLPKVNVAEDLQRLHKELRENRDVFKTKIWAMMETPQGVINASDICSKLAGVLSCLVIGTEDLVKALRCQHTVDRTPVLYALSTCVMAARANNLSVIDGVYTDVKNNDGFTAQCSQALQLGFDGKTVIHPNQIESCNTVFSPSPAQLAQAEKIVNAMAEARAQGKAIATVDGRMVEQLHAEYAQYLIGFAKSIQHMQTA